MPSHGRRSPSSVARTARIPSSSRFIDSGVSLPLSTHCGKIFSRIANSRLTQLIWRSIDTGIIFLPPFN
jgi:hypothetical protein